MRAGAGEVVDEVDTGSSVEARPRVALVDIILTVHPLVAWFTLRQCNTREKLVAHCGEIAANLVLTLNL